MSQLSNLGHSTSVVGGMRSYKMIGGGSPPDYVEMRYCPKDAGHWRVDEPSGRCPVCKTKIETAIYIYEGVLDSSGQQHPLGNDHA